MMNHQAVRERALEGFGFDGDYETRYAARDRERYRREQQRPSAKVVPIRPNRKEVSVSSPCPVCGQMIADGELVYDRSPNVWLHATCLVVLQVGE